MQWLRELWRRLLFPFRRQQFDRDLDEEMRFHLEMKARASGAAAAKRAFGNTALLQEDSRAAWGWSGAEACVADFKYALRALRKDRGFTTVAIMTIALGIGATTAIFSVVNSVVLRPLPFRHPDRIAMLWHTDERNREHRGVVSYEVFREWKQQSRSFEQVSAYDGESAQMIVGGEPVELHGAAVSSGFFEALGIAPLFGRDFLPEEHRQSASAVAILSYDLWKRLGGDRGIAGKTVQFDRKPFLIAGVMPAGFAYPMGASELWFPWSTDDPRNRGARYLKVIARLKPGIPVSRAQSDLQTITARLDAGKYGLGAEVVPLDEQILGETRRVLLILMGAVGCVFLIACMNVANLLLVRATARRRDLALRLALGAGRWRVLRTVLAESLLLALGGGILGVLAAYWLVRLFVAIDPIHMPRIAEVAVDGTVLQYAAAAIVATGIAFGLLPAFRGSSLGLAAWLKEGPGAPGAGEFGKSRTRGILAAAQIALAVMLLIGAGLLMRSFVARVNVRLGFRPEGSLGVELPWSANRRIDELVARLRALPSVTAAGASTAFPQNAPFLSCGGCVDLQGQTRRAGTPDETGLVVATPGYFEAAGMRLLRGRFFTPSDGAESPKVAILNQAMAMRDFGNDDAVGRHVRWESDQWATVVGIVANVKGFGGAGSPGAAIYFPNRQVGWYNPVQVLVRTSAPPAGLSGAVRHEIRAWNPRLVIRKIDTVEGMLSSTVAAPRFYLLLMAGFAMVALAVAAVGIYGTISYSVARRTHEIGIRIALGAGRADVLWMVLRQGFAMTTGGLALGLAGAWTTVRLIESLLFGIRPTDAAAFAAGSGVLLLVALLASVLPARRATRVDPLEALRHD